MQTSQSSQSSPQPLTSICIVGGGSSGWMTAIYLNRFFNQFERRVQVQLVESDDINIIGVGEATVHSIRYFFAAMGLDERELMQETNATFKTGIMFRNWKKPVDGKMHEYFHPFDHVKPPLELDINSSWLLDRRFETERYDQGVSLSAALIEAGHTPKTANSAPYMGVVPYGYHLDAVKMARYLRRKAIEAGVIHTVATVHDVETAGEQVLAIHTDQGRFTADVFIDCTGFRGLLLGSLKSDNWQSFTDALPCNKAVAIQRELPGPAKPYTTATAISHGWVWEIDLANRQGTGYVYDGAKLTREQAEAELREYLGPDSAVLKCTHLDMNVGCRREFWVGNCIAIGLAGGFIEPLESTGLHLVNLGARLLSTHLAGPVSQATRDSYNRLMNGFYTDLKQFIVLHYCLTDRDDTEFWREAAQKAMYCEGLPQQLQAWQSKVCEYMDLAGTFSTTFTDENYRYILYGMDYLPQLQPMASQRRFDPVFAQVQQQGRHAVFSTIPLSVYISGYHQVS